MEKRARSRGVRPTGPMMGRAPLLGALFFAFAALALGCTCAESHGRDDAGLRAGDTGPCGETGRMCVYCGGDVLMSPVCEGGAWRCPAGMRFRDECPPDTCWGPPPPGCSCVGGRWDCEPPDPTECPPGINPWRADDPANACGVEGATCRSGGSDPCGGAMGCECHDGRWTCWVAEPDPVCWCGRTPSEGDRCAEEGASCGADCCSGIGGFRCVGGHWRGVDCGPSDCARERCPAVRPPGSPCDAEGLVCGDVCCGADECRGGRWTAAPGADCFCDPARTFDCGTGSCTEGSACTMLEYRCGTTASGTFACTPIPEGCRDCSCVPAQPERTCEVVDGRVQLHDVSRCD